MWWKIIILLLNGYLSNGQLYDYNVNSNDIFFDQLKCPEHWVQFQQSCYRFIKSPLRPYKESRKICQSFVPEAGGSDLVSIDNHDEHGFLIYQLTWQDPQHRRWYIGVHQLGPNNWQNVNGNSLSHMENAFFPDNESYGKDYLVYSYSKYSMRWGFQPVKGDEYLLYICEANIQSIQTLIGDDRTYKYGIDIDNPEQIPRGPYFIRQPSHVTFDLSKRKIYNDAVLSCFAGGYPTPAYQWFREDYENDRLVAREIDPLKDARYTISGGTLLINNPEQKEDRATYHCKASNKYGVIISESAELNFGFIMEFVLKRSVESGDQNWGKAIFCDPPTHFPGVKYYWSRDYFPNFVEEDKRVFVSYDGTLYFSALETIDRGNYSCSVQSEVSDTGRNGPFFPLQVNPHSNYQKLKFPNNFPKAFPEAPTAGKDVRLECMVFGYPIPSYNWTRKDGGLPRSARLSAFNRVLIIPQVKVEDQGEYVCTVYNDRDVIDNSVTLNIQAEPNFTIPLTDKHIDSRGQLVWTCEAFGIPDVNYTWWRNGRQLVMGYLDPEDRGRIRIQDNVLTITHVDDERDPGMYQCRASNTLRSKYSSAQLRVLAFKPSFKKRPLESETYAAEHGNVTIKCNPEAAPKPRFVWKKNMNILGSGGHRRILENGNLVINPVSRDDEGIYTCTATNELGMDESHGRLIVLHTPRLVESLRPRIITSVYKDIYLQCHAETEEMLDVAYIWNHNGMRIKDNDIKHIETRVHLSGGSLYISNSTFSDAGDYECVVKSAVGEISSKSTIIVEGPPGPPGGLQVISIRRTSVTLQWIDGDSHGRPIFAYTISGRTNWNNTWINITHGVRATEIDRNSGRKEAEIDNILTPWSVYEFRVNAWNELGMGLPSAPSPRQSTPADRPFIPPDNISGGGGKSGDLTITWTPLLPQEQNGPGIHYKVFWKRKDYETEFQTLLLKEFGNTGKAVVYISKEYYYTEYVVKVQPFNDIGAGPQSQEVIIFSAEKMPLVPPQLVSALSFNSTALNVSWNPIEEIRPKIGGKLIGYRIKYWKNEGKEEESVYYLSRTTTPWALIVGLQPDTYYFVKAMAYNSAGEGPESERYLERTYRKAPQKPPTSVHIFGVNPSTVRVVWRYIQPSLDEEPVQGYKIRVWEVDQDMSKANDTIIPVGGKLEAYVDNLSPGKTYHMRVLAFSNGGDGRMSSPPLTFQMGSPASYRSGAVKLNHSVSFILSISMVVNWFAFLRVV